MSRYSFMNATLMCGIKMTLGYASESRRDTLFFFRVGYITGQATIGVITIGELAAVVQSLNERPTKEEVEEMMNEMEVDGDGSIDFEGFVHIIVRKIKENIAEELKEAFKVFDRDQDGFISDTELMNVMINLGERLTNEEAHQMCREADLGGDGLVSYDEFSRIMMALST